MVSADFELVWTDFYLVSTDFELVSTDFERGAGIFAERLHTILNRNANHSHLDSERNANHSHSRLNSYHSHSLTIAHAPCLFRTLERTSAAFVNRLFKILP